MTEHSHSYPDTARRALENANLKDAEEFCKGAFPFVVDASPYVKVIAELMQHATDRALSRAVAQAEREPDAMGRSVMQRLLDAAGWDALSLRHKQLQDALDGARLEIVPKGREQIGVQVPVPQVLFDEKTMKNGCSESAQKWSVEDDYRALLEAIDHTLSVHGHIDANTPLHDRLSRTLALSSTGCK